MRRTLLLALLACAVNAAAAGRELAPPPIEATSYRTSGVQTAYAGDRFLTVWNEWRPVFGPHIRATFADANGRRITSESFQVAAPGSHEVLHLASMGDRFVLLHMSGSAVAMSEIALDGNVLVTRALDLPAVSDYDWAIGWNGSHFLIAARVAGYDSMRVYVVDREGRRVTGELLPLDGGFGGMSVFAHGDGFRLFASGVRGLFRYTIGIDGTISTDTIERQTRTAGIVAAPAADGAVMVVWVVEQSSRYLLRSSLVTSTGPWTAQTILESERRLFPAGLLRTGDGWVLTYSDYSNAADNALYAMRLDASGALASNPAVAAQLPSWAEVKAAANDRVVFDVWVGGAVIPEPVASVVVGSDAQTRLRETIAVSPRRQSAPSLAALGFRQVAAWSETSATTALVRHAIVAVDGEPELANLWSAGLSARQRLARNAGLRARRSADPQRLASRELAPAGEVALVLHTSDGSLLASRVTADGANLDADEPIHIGTMEMTTPAAGVTWTGLGWAVVWPGDAYGTTMRFANVSASGRVSGARELPLPHARRARAFVDTIALAFDGRNLLLVWGDREPRVCPLLCPPNVLQVFAVRLELDGSLRDQPLAMAATYTDSVSVATSGGEFFVVAGEHGRVVDARNGLRIARSIPLFTWLAASDVTWNGSEYVVALRYAGVNAYLAARRFDANGNEIGAARGAQTLLAEDLTPSVAATSANDSLIAVQEGDAGRGMRAVVYRERELLPLPPPPQPPQNVHVLPGPYSSATVTWDPPPGPQPELYVVEMDYDGEWEIVARAPAPARNAAIELVYGPLRVRAFGPGGGSEPVEAGALPRRRSVRR